jgi:hypothetical protein
MVHGVTLTQRDRLGAADYGVGRQSRIAALPVTLWSNPQQDQGIWTGHKRGTFDWGEPLH